ncbi:hypothetical protein BaRGS_00027627 [Batillaria attramentaria]|uniref:VWFA domain-containing protein n=1 Tax=Batillaria attramentaria TaxID=370345 RepID=A0ABD0K147_9CAEN
MKEIPEQFAYGTAAPVPTIVVPASKQFTVDRSKDDGMVSDAWFDDIMTDSWNGVPRASDTEITAVQEQKRFLTDLSALFSLHKTTTRVGIVSYGHIPLLTTPLGQYDSLPEIHAALLDTPRVGGDRRTAQALKYLRVRAFAPEVARREVAHVVILMTNGYSADAEDVAEEASLLRKQGVYVYIVATAGSSTAVDKPELTDIASEPVDKFLFTSEDYSIVDSLIELLRIKECNYQVLPPLPGKEPVCSARRPTEIAFAVEHLGMGSPKTQKIIDFIQAMLAEVDPDSSIKAAILTSKDPISRKALSRQVETIQHLEKKLGGVVFPNLGNLLRRARRTLSRGSNDAITAQKVLLVFMDESVRMCKGALAEAKKNHRSKVDTYVVYIGKEVSADSMAEIRSVASGSDHVIYVPSFDDLGLQSVVESSLKTVCRGESVF